MPERSEGRGRPLEVIRERAVEALCEEFAGDALEMEELERRLDRAHRAGSVSELRELLADLPGARGALERTRPAGGERGAGVPAPREGVPERKTVLAVLGGNSRRGRWVPARITRCLAVCGGVELDFTEASLPPGVTEIRALAVMGGIEVVVPPGTYVESEGLAILGGFENRDFHAVDARPSDPVVRIRGLALMGGVDVTVRRPGETKSQARRRRRQERRADRKELPDE